MSAPLLKVIRRIGAQFGYAGLIIASLVECAARFSLQLSYELKVLASDKPKFRVLADENWERARICIFSSGVNVINFLLNPFLDKMSEDMLLGLRPRIYDALESTILRTMTASTLLHRHTCRNWQNIRRHLAS